MMPPDIINKKTNSIHSYPSEVQEFIIVNKSDKIIDNVILVYQQCKQWTIGN